MYCCCLLFFCKQKTAYVMRISYWSSDVCSSDLYLREHLPDEITINHMDEQALLALQGPKAIQALSRLVAGVDDLVFMQAGSFRWRDHDLWISRSGYTGEDGFEISLPAEAITAFADELCALEEVKPIGLGARDSLRL